MKASRPAEDIQGASLPQDNAPWSRQIGIRMLTQPFLKKKKKQSIKGLGSGGPSKYKLHNASPSHKGSQYLQTEQAV